MSPGPQAAADRSLLDVLEDPRFVNLFVHDAVSAAPFEASTRRIPGLHHFDQRALLLAGARDLVCLRERPDAAYLDYFVGLGLGTPRERIVTPEDLGAPRADGPCSARLLAHPPAVAELIRRVCGGRRIRLHSFLAGSGEFALADALERAGAGPVQVAGGRHPVIDDANQKHRMRARALELGIPVVRGEVVELVPGAASGIDLSPLRAAVARQQAPTGSALVRGTRGASGSATLVTAADGAALAAQLDELVRRGANRLFLVDPLLPVTASPNLQLHIDPDSGAVERVGLTDQLLTDGVEHRGNVYPSRARRIDAMWRHAEALGRWLAEAGCNGIVGFDFCEVEPGVLDSDHFLAEVNARTNGATYTIALFERVVRRALQAGRIPPRAFVARPLATRQSGFAAVQRILGDLLVDSGTATGLVPFNLATLPHGQLQVLALAATPEAAEELCREAGRRLL